MVTTLFYRSIWLLPIAYMLVAAQQQDRTEYVDVFHGTEGGGNMFPGVVAAPFAMVKLGPDVSSGQAEAYSGYLSQGTITGFSMMHESGTGGAPKYGVVSQLPVAGEIENPLNDLSASRASPDEGSVGYYKSSLMNGVTAELAGTEHTGAFLYTFSEGPSSVLVDVSHVLPSYRGMGWNQGYAGGNMTIFDDGHYEGSGTYNNGWNKAPNWTIHFCGQFDTAPTSGRTFIGSETTLESYGEVSSVSGSKRLGAVFTFEATEVMSRVGVSFISSDRACEYIDRESPADKSFTSLIDDAVSRWNTEVFGKVTTAETGVDNLRHLYSSLYGMHLLPSNRTGENPLWTSSEPYYDDFYTLWDTHRCATPLQHILQPRTYEEQIRSLIDTWRNEGWMPDGRSSNYNGRTQGGSHADTVLADAYVKGVRGGINWEDGFDAMLADAENEPPNTDDPSARDSSVQQGRGALPDWNERGFITLKYTRSVSRAVEYAGNDFGLFQVANGLGRTQEANKYLARSRNWRNHWDENATSLGFSGFLVPRNNDASGSFVEQDPLSCGACYWVEPYYQGLPWQYTLNPVHDAATLIEWSGGKETFLRRLDTFFKPGRYPERPKANNTIFDPTNQPSLGAPYLYSFAGRQDLTVKQTRQIANAYYSPGRAGIPGNSDAGAMQSYILWMMIGLYPVVGQTTFLIVSPWFESITIDLGGGKALEVTASGGGDRKTRDFYVQSLKVNGGEWKQVWVTWDDVFRDGGRLDFELGPEPTVWWDESLEVPSPASHGEPRWFRRPTVEKMEDGLSA
ncbi:glycoside hydrolase family 92 protein [Patellaria atrata CBS 101060]|uniref:Glycoside hydrolase family 92 protein n=1 Tax=Patellaria atrata CBS 101060 TaxID=1346257 RepID=A0A9P4SEW4_9PEZI|nr:glycoside hydrolase family 92 protein [Patellaria atrata CBS 101060]